MALTKRTVDAFRFDPKGPARQILWDGDIPGFGVRVQPTGTKSFIVLYRVRTGRSRLLTLGRYGVLTVDQARKAARAELAEVAEGGDPVADRQAQRQAVRVAEFCDDYIERHAKRHKKTWTEDQRRIRTHIVPKWGTRALTDVKRPDVARLHGRIGAEKPYEANRVLALIAVMWGKAEEWGHLPDGHPNPARNIQPFREQERDRYATPEELPRLLKAIDADRDPFMRAAFLLYLLTGLRRSELLRLRWDQVDRASRLIRLMTTCRRSPRRRTATTT